MTRHVPIEPGMRFGEWVVVERAPSYKNRSARYLCACDCGRTRFVAAGNLLYGKSTKCLACKNTKYRAFTPAQNLVIGSYQRSAKARGLSFNLDRGYVIKITSLNCHYCGSGPSNTSINKQKTSEYKYNGIDRVDNSVGYEPGNCVPCCKTCNLAKNNMTHAEWVSYIKRLTQHQNRKTKQRITATSNVCQSQMIIN